MPLNEGQVKGVEDLIDWFFNTNEKYITLSGPGGTGKTYMLKEFTKALEEENKRRAQAANLMHVPLQFAATATQNSPAAGLREAGFTGAGTIHSLLGLRMLQDYQTGAETLSTDVSADAKRREVAQLDYIIVDECSHASHYLHHYLDSFNTRIIYVGDSAQLQSIEPDEENKGFSVFNLGFRALHLKENMRANSESLKQRTHDLRECVLAGQSVKHLITDNGTDIRVLDDADYMATMAAAFQKYPDGEQVKVIGFTNATVDYYNRETRGLLDLPTSFERGDVGIVGSQYGGHAMRLSPSTRLIVEDISAQGITAPVVPETLGVMEMSFQDLEDHTMTVADNYLELQKALKDCRYRKDFAKMFAIKDNIMDLRFPYAETGHKSQGRTYNYVFVDLPCIMTARDSQLIARLIYVAVSRARLFVAIRKPTYYGNY